MVELREAARLSPDEARWHHALAEAHLHEREVVEAESHYRKAIAIDPAASRSHQGLGIALVLSGEIDDAMACYRSAAALDTTWAEPRVALAWLLLKHPEKESRDVKEARECALDAVRLTESTNVASLDVLSAVHAEMGSFEESVRAAEAALALPASAGEERLRASIEERLQVYRSRVVNDQVAE